MATGNTTAARTFVKAAKAMHGDRYSYEKVEYVNARTPVTIVCKKHGDFEQAPYGHSIGKQGCKTCLSESATLTTAEFIRRAKEVHGNRYDYTPVKYESSCSRVSIRCPTHGLFQQTPTSHLVGKGCDGCGRANQIAGTRVTQAEFVERARAVHNNFYKYKRASYAGSGESVIVTCPKHGDFSQKAASHLAGHGCLACTKVGHSVLAINAIEAYAKMRNWKHVRHAKAGGEFAVPGTRYRADGFHAKSRTIIEFHGDQFHGNPKRFKPNDRIAPFAVNKHGQPKKAKTLYRKTLKKQNALLALGFNVVVIWEQDYRDVLANKKTLAEIVEVHLC